MTTITCGEGTGECQRGAERRPDVESSQCAACGQERPLWRYRPEHETHWDMADCVFCRWCAREEQPLLCGACYEAESGREANAPLFAADQAAIAILAGRSPGRREYERDAPTAARDGGLAPVPPVRGQLALDEVTKHG